MSSVGAGATARPVRVEADGRLAEMSVATLAFFALPAMNNNSYSLKSTRRNTRRPHQSGGLIYREYAVNIGAVSVFLSRR
jgi:hypothetical protein